jgi:hypothetical protein
MIGGVWNQKYSKHIISFEMVLCQGCRLFLMIEVLAKRKIAYKILNLEDEGCKSWFDQWNRFRASG